MNLPSGHILQNGKYRITSVIGQGGFGITYKGVWNTEVKGPLGTIKTEIPVCIKEYFFKDYCYRETDSCRVMVHSDMGKALFERFKEKQIKESKILSEVQHPYIVNVLEAFEENNTAYIVMEYISGYSLKYYLDREGFLQEGHVLHYIRQIGEALQFIHGKSILHLDIKPSNIIIDVDGNARLIDFGVSKRYDIEQRETSTTTLTLSKGFASIEQYDSEGIQSFTPCPDVYSLGATMYNLLTGVIPTESILRATKSLSRPRELNAAISVTTEAVIMKAMQVVPEDRYQSIQEILDALDFTIEEKKPTLHISQNKEEKEPETVHESGSDDGEETIVNQTISKSKYSKRGRNNKKSVAIIFSLISLLLLIAGISSAIFIKNRKDASMQHIQNLQPVTNKEIVAEKNKESKDVLVKEDPLGAVYTTKKSAETKKVEEVSPKKNPVSSSSTTNKSDKDKQQKPASLPKEKSVTPSSQVNQNKEDKRVEQPKKVAVTDKKADAQKEYEKYYQEGLQKMNRKEYSEAKKDFQKAKTFKVTEEIVRMEIRCDENMKQQQIKERLALYEVKRSFGQLTIVRKKLSGRYGAINAEAKEKIPCKYLNVGITDNGRAFEREDGLFDIYNKNGELINNGSTYY